MEFRKMVTITLYAKLFLKMTLPHVILKSGASQVTLVVGITYLSMEET